MTDMKEKFAFLLLNTVSAGIFQVNGVRGKCAFSSLGDWFDIVMGFVRLWFSPVYKHCDFVLGDMVSSEVTEYILCVLEFLTLFSVLP